MTSFNEGDINRATDGKFAAKTTAETDASALDFEPSDPPRFDYDNMEGADLGEITDGKTTQISLVDVGDVTVSYGTDEDDDEYVQFATTRSLSVDPDLEATDVEGVLKQRYLAHSVSSHGQGLYDATFARQVYNNPFPTVEDAHYELTRNDELNEINRLVDSGTLNEEMTEQVKLYRADLDRASHRANNAWSATAGDKPFPYDAMREAFNDNEPSSFISHADTWAEGYAGTRYGQNENFVARSYRQEGFEAAQKNGAL